MLTMLRERCCRPLKEGTGLLEPLREGGRGALYALFGSNKGFGKLFSLIHFASSAEDVAAPSREEGLCA